MHRIDNEVTSDLEIARSLETQRHRENMFLEKSHKRNVKKEDGQHWYLLLHQLPPKPPYFRAKVLRRLKKIGALAIKNSAYVLPANEDTLEDLQWIRQLIKSGDGEAWIFEIKTIAGYTDDTLRNAFKSMTAKEYEYIETEVRDILDEFRDIPLDSDKEPYSTIQNRIRKLRKQSRQIEQIDFFGAREDSEVNEALSSLESAIERKTASNPARQPEPSSLKNRLWVTRRGIKVDRIASAWFIRRFIDSSASFKYVDAETYEKQDDDIRFDMFEGEFTHVGDMCTFEVLLTFTEIENPSLRIIAEIVHDIDLKDSKFGRMEAAGIAAVLHGIIESCEKDEERLLRGADLFETLYKK